MAMGDFSLFITAGAVLFVGMLFCYYMSERQKKDLATSMALVAAARHMTVILPMTSPDTLPVYTPRFVIVTIPTDTPPSYEPQNTPQPEANGEATNTSLPQEPSTVEQQQAPVYSESTSAPPPSSSPSPQQVVAPSPA
ncbi:hypothetical protein BGZ82_001057 [Podila clonocystis]|nr:hypothetical protein BGZ82_001057 [Podila clonocystis]